MFKILNTKKYTIPVLEQNNYQKIQWKNKNDSVQYLWIGKHIIDDQLTVLI